MDSSSQGHIERKNKHLTNTSVDFVDVTVIANPYFLH